MLIFFLSATDVYNLDDKFVVSEPLVELFLRNLLGERAFRRDGQVPPGTVCQRAGDGEWDVAFVPNRTV